MDKKAELNIEGYTYLNHASIGPMPKSTLKIVSEFSNNHSKMGSNFIAFDQLDVYWERIMSTYSKLINGKPEGITMTSNTASGLHLVADGLNDQYRSGQNIVLTELEFTTNSYMWQKIAKRHSLELRVIPFRENNFLEEDITRLIDDNTILTTISYVQYSNGYRADLDYIGNLVHDHGGYLCVDAIQGLGVVPLDISNTPIDFLATGGYKWLLGPMGTGFFYTRPEHLDLLDTVLVGWFATPTYHKMSHNEYHPWDDARRFQQSFNMNHLALENSVSMLMDWGIQNNYNHITSLIDYLVDQIDVPGITVDSNLEDKHRSGILKINVEKDSVELVNYLKDQGIVVAPRAGAVRISPHAHNTKDEIDYLIYSIEKWNYGSEL